MPYDGQITGRRPAVPLIDLAVFAAYVSEVIRVVSMVIPSGPARSLAVMFDRPLSFVHVLVADFGSQAGV